MFCEAKIYSLEYISVLFQIKSPWKVLVGPNMNKPLWCSVGVPRRLCCPPPPYGCRVCRRPPLLWSPHCSRTRSKRLLSTWTQTRLLNSDSTHLWRPCWCSASLTAAGETISSSSANSDSFLNIIWNKSLCSGKHFKQYCYTITWPHPCKE